MGKTHKGDECLRALVRLVLPVFKRAEKENPRTGRGDKPQVPDWFMGVLIMIAVLKKKKRKSAQYRYLLENRQQIAGQPAAEHEPGKASADRVKNAAQLPAAFVEREFLLKHRELNCTPIRSCA